MDNVKMCFNKALIEVKPNYESRITQCSNYDELLKFVESNLTKHEMEQLQGIFMEHLDKAHDNESITVETGEHDPSIKPARTGTLKNPDYDKT